MELVANILYFTHSTVTYPTALALSPTFRDSPHLPNPPLPPLYSFGDFAVTATTDCFVASECALLEA